MCRSKSKNEIIFRGILFLILILFVLTACVNPITSFPGVSTWTPSPSLTPTCAPNIDLSTPVGWDVSPHFIAILYDPKSIQGEPLEFSNGETTQDINEFLNRVIPKIVRPGDQISVFQLGYSPYEAARVVRIYSYIERPQLYDTPAPYETLTPIATTIGTSQPGLGPIATANWLRAQLTAHAATAQVLEATDNCKRIIWNQSAFFTATSWAQTEIAEVRDISTDVGSTVNDFDKTIIANEIAYRKDVVYEGLSYASNDIGTDCKKYNKCMLIIIDDLHSWTSGKPGNLSIELPGVDVYIIMPNCKDINQPSCTKLQNFWNGEFKKFGTDSVIYNNTIRTEINLEEAIRR